MAEVEGAVLCRICQRSEINHSGVRHIFTPPYRPVDTSQFASKRPSDDVQGNTSVGPAPVTYSMPQTPFDPVLRQALLDKGVLTMDELEAARRKVVMMTRAVDGND